MVSVNVVRTDGNSSSNRFCFTKSLAASAVLIAASVNSSTLFTPSRSKNMLRTLLFMASSTGLDPNTLFTVCIVSVSGSIAFFVLRKIFVRLLLRDVPNSSATSSAISIPCFAIVLVTASIVESVITFDADFAPPLITLFVPNSNHEVGSEATSKAISLAKLPVFQSQFGRPASSSHA